MRSLLPVQLAYESLFELITRKGVERNARAASLPGGSAGGARRRRGAPGRRRRAAKTTAAEGRGARAQPSCGCVLTTLGRVLIACHQRASLGALVSAFWPSGVIEK